MSIIRQPAVTQESGHPRSTIYWLVASGLFPKQVKIGVRSAGWIKSEVDAIVAARVAGKGDDEIRALVADLHAQRTPAAVNPTAPRAAETSQAA